MRPYLDLGVFISYLCDLFFIFILIFIMINRIISWIQTHLFFCLFSRICPIIFPWRMWIIFKQQKFSVRVLLSIWLSFCQFQPGVAYKIVAYIKKACIYIWQSSKGKQSKTKFFPTNSLCTLLKNHQAIRTEKIATHLNSKAKFIWSVSKNRDREINNWFSEWWLAKRFKQML